MNIIDNKKLWIKVFAITIALVAITAILIVFWYIVLGIVALVAGGYLYAQNKDFKEAEKARAKRWAARRKRWMSGEEKMP